MTRARVVTGMRRFVLLLLVPALAGCAWGGDEPPGATTTPGTPTTPTRDWPPLVFGGTVVHAVTGEPILGAQVRLDLAQARPCGQQGVTWTGWSIPVAEDGRWGPYEVPRPKSDDVAFFLHASAEGYGRNDTFVGPQQARAGIDNISLVLHPLAAVEGLAPPGTVLALAAPGFPRVLAVNASGRFAFEEARVVPASFVAALDVPARVEVTAPATLNLSATSERGWVLEGVVKGPSGAGLAADVVAWNGTRLWSAARSGETGFFALPLPPEPVTLRVEARTADDHYGASKRVEVAGPPALRETLLARARC